QRVFFGTVTNPKNEKLHDLTPREILTFVPLIIMALWIGLYPKPFFQILEQPVNQIVQTIHDNSNPNAPVNAQNVPQGLKSTFLPVPNGIAESVPQLKPVNGTRSKPVETKASN